MKVFIAVRESSESLDGSLLFTDKVIAANHVNQMDEEFGEEWLIKEGELIIHE